MRFQVTSKLIRPNSWIMQTVRQRIPNCWARNGESTIAKSAAMDAWNDELTATGGSQMLAPPVRGNFNVVNHIAHSSCYPRRARSALGVDTVLTLDVCLYVCMLVL